MIRPSVGITKIGMLIGFYIFQAKQAHSVSRHTASDDDDDDVPLVSLLD